MVRGWTAPAASGARHGQGGLGEVPALPALRPQPPLLGECGAAGPREPAASQVWGEPGGVGVRAPVVPARLWKGKDVPQPAVFLAASAAEHPGPSPNSELPQVSERWASPSSSRGPHPGRQARPAVVYGLCRLLSASRAVLGPRRVYAQLKTKSRDY